MITNNSINKDTMGMYIHIPFCVKKCIYCDFLSKPAQEQVIDEYVRALIKELRVSAEEFEKKKVKTIFFGGGTPSILKEKQTADIMEAVYSHYKVDENAEITTEANPGTLSYEKLKNYRNLGINRLSMGLQTTDNSELKTLGRIHTYEKFLEEYDIARNVGFNNINIDLMSAIPDQTVESYVTTLQRIVKLKPEHISAYSLIIEENTPLYDMYERGELDGRLADEDAERKMYYETKRILSEYGYNRYEISNYSLKGYECRHNLSYWERINYAGFGTGAASLIDELRYTNTGDISGYIADSSDLKKIRKEVHKLSRDERMEEYMFLGLRKMNGVSIRQFKEEFGVDIMDVYKDVIDKFKEEKLLECMDDRIYLTDMGIDVSNVVMAEFLLYNTLRWRYCNEKDRRNNI